MGGSQEFEIIPDPEFQIVNQSGIRHLESGIKLCQIQNDDIHTLARANAELMTL